MINRPPKASRAISVTTAAKVEAADGLFRVSVLVDLSGLTAPPWHMRWSNVALLEAAEVVAGDGLPNASGLHTRVGRSRPFLVALVEATLADREEKLVSAVALWEVTFVEAVEGLLDTSVLQTRGCPSR